MIKYLLIISYVSFALHSFVTVYDENNKYLRATIIDFLLIISGLSIVVFILLSLESFFLRPNGVYDLFYWLRARWKFSSKKRALKWMEGYSFDYAKEYLENQIKGCEKEGRSVQKGYLTYALKQLIKFHTNT
jgi:hypothetical protein